MIHVMTIRAYERKTELGGGFRAVASVRPDGLAFGLRNEESGVIDTFEAARFEAQSIAHRQMNGRTYQRAYIAQRRHRMHPKYIANIWVEDTHEESHV